MHRFLHLALPAALSLASCATDTVQPQSGMLGFGTPGVSAYTAEGDRPSLQAELDQCGRVPQTASASPVRGLPAACDQLRRTSRNQPGNSVQPTPPR